MFEIYKQGQGVTARWIAAIGLLAMSAFGCFELYAWLTTMEWASAPLFGGVMRATVVSGVAFVVAAVLVGLAVNYARFVDYLIVSEMELRKVSWPTRGELKRQTTVVIIAILFFAAVLYIADLGLVWVILKEIFGLKGAKA